MMPVTFIVHGTPAPQGSKRHVGHGRMVESSKAVGPWRDAVRGETQRRFSGGRGWPHGVPLGVVVVFRFPRPAGHYGTGCNSRQVKPSAPGFPAGSKNDLDKLARATLDGLADGGAMNNDGQVVNLSLFKTYCGRDEVPGATITIRGHE